MSESQILIMLGTIWIAPHINKWYAQITGLIFICVASAKGLGLI